ncbi:MAG: 50S ribosomal protein L29 [Methylococcales bacterium]|nr:50S ribosomal protein L29 [Methylococcales bacterium]
MKASELREKTEEELNALLVEKSREQFNLRMQKGTSQLNKPDQMKKVRRDVARIHTILHQMASA